MRAPSWSAEHDAHLRQQYGVHTAREIAGQLGRTVSSVKSRVTILDITAPSWWTAKELRVIAENRPCDAARILNRSYDACKAQKARLTM